MCGIGLSARRMRGLVRVMALCGLFCVEARGAQLSLRFAGGGSEVTLAYGETTQIKVVWTMAVTDTAKSGAKLTGLNLRFTN